MQCPTTTLEKSILLNHIRFREVQRILNLLGQVPRSNIPATGSHMILQERCGKVTGSHRKAPEIAGSGSSIPTGNLLDFFPVDSDQFPVLSSRNRSEIIGKNPKIFRLEYCFHVPVTSGAFLPEPARIFRPGFMSVQNLFKGLEFVAK